MSTDDRVGGYRGGKPASEMGPPAKLPSGSVAPCPTCGPGYRYGDDGCRHEPTSVDALRTRLARAFEVAALRDPSAELAAFEAAVRREQGERIAKAIDADAEKRALVMTETTTAARINGLHLGSRIARDLSPPP